MNAEGVAHHARWQAVVLPLLQFADHPWRVRRKQVLGVSIVKPVTAVGVMTYARVAGHISPAGAETAKSGVNPALSRNCHAPATGMSQVDRFAPNGRQPSEEGRFVRRAAAGPLPPQTRRFFISGRTLEPPRRVSLPEEDAAPAGRPRHLSFALSWSGGKDSALALWTLRRQGLAPEALITTVTERFERISMHGVRRELLARQAKAVDFPLVEVVIPPECVNDVYEARMAEAFAAAPLSGVEAVAFGDLFLEDVRAYREERLAAGGKRGLFPLWGRDTTALAHEFLDAGFEATVVCVDSRALDAAFAGRRYDAQLLAELPPGVDPCGENGEFHTFVTAGPIFAQPIACEAGEVVERGGFVFCDLTPA
jgi:uncharacterized protein (TIGR00290 family)